MAVFFGIDITMLVLALIVVIVACIAVGLALKKIRETKRVKLRKLTADPLRLHLQVQKIPTAATKNPPGYQGNSSTAELPKKEIDCIHGMTTISQSLVALAEKYSLDAIILATSDGLLLASSRPGIPDDEVARYCRDNVVDPAGEHPGVTLFGMEHKGSSLVGIVYQNQPVSPESRQKLIGETKDILNWWI